MFNCIFLLVFVYTHVALRLLESRKLKIKKEDKHFNVCNYGHSHSSNECVFYACLVKLAVRPTLV